MLDSRIDFKSISRVSIGGLLENINSEYFILARNGSAVYASSELSIGLVELNKLTTYVKASNTDPNDYMGYSVALSDDGSTLAVGAFRDASNATGVNGNPFDNSMTNAGSVLYTVTTVRTGTNKRILRRRTRKVMTNLAEQFQSLQMVTLLQCLPVEKAVMPQV